jgi:hypothetical protein
MIGTNDCDLNYDIPNIHNRLDALVERIFTNKPSVRLLLATVTPSSKSGTEANIQTLNAHIPSIVTYHKSLGRNIQLVPMHDALNVSTDLYDPLHPNSTGYAKMANAWYDAVTYIPVLSLFQDCGYGGWKADFDVGEFTLSDIVAAGGQDNDVSSMKINPGYKVTFYEYDNFQGNTLVKTADTNCLSDDSWDETVSSMIVELDPVMMCHWQFNDNSGSLASDSSGYGYDGQLMNMDSTAWTTGKHCGGLSFDGVDDYVEITGYKGITGGANRTCMAWIKTSEVSGEILTWGKGSSGGNKWIIRIDVTGALRTEVQGGYIYGNTLINDGIWHHIAVVLNSDGSPNVSELLLYVDGQLETTTTSAGEPINTIADQDVMIGVFGATMTRYFNGLIDDVRIYNYALDPAAIQDVYQQYALVADVEPDGDVDLSDFATLASSWQILDPCQSDLTCDCVVDIYDLMILVDEWLDSI